MSDLRLFVKEELSYFASYEMVFVRINGFWGRQFISSGFAYSAIWLWIESTMKRYNDVTMAATASLITSLTIVYSTVYSSADQRKHQSSASLAFVRGLHRRPVNSPHKWPVTRKMFPFDDVIIIRFQPFGNMSGKFKKNRRSASWV